MKSKYKQKCITIRVDQNVWIKNNSINLSVFVQQKLDERMLRDK